VNLWAVVQLDSSRNDCGTIQYRTRVDRSRRGELRGILQSLIDDRHQLGEQLL
jgi:hypothetical protein